MSQFIVIGSYRGSSDWYEHEASCTGRRLPVVEVKERGLNITGRTSYARWSEGEYGIMAADWLYCWYEVKPGDTVTLATEDWPEEAEEPTREQLIVTVPDGGWPHPPSTLEELQACTQHRYYGLVSRGENTVLEVVAWGIGGLMTSLQIAPEQCSKLIELLAADTGIAAEHIAVDGNKHVVTFCHGTPMAAQETLLRQLHQALGRVNRRWYPTLVAG